MINLFRQKIHEAITNPQLHAALDGNYDRRVNARLQSMASLPDYEERRQMAQQVRAEVIEHLEQYLDQFVAQVQSHGVIVHRAADAAEAVQAALEIAAAHGAKRFAKSKSMVSEEIELNHALEQAGLEVVETDLGEYIVQIRGEKPAHIITPAVHLRRQEVGQTFHEKLGIPLTDDIPTLTSAARVVLRQVFLDAEIGLSGVNFGVAESGTMVVLTNEGNGRLVTTLPPVHIALMGIERLVPNFDDLALMLSLLPRSATGQKITVYASLLHGPRAAQDADGPAERHLILVDNGRRALRESLLKEALYCIRCGACLNACPVFREIGGHAYVGVHGQGSSYPGPIGSVISPAFFGYGEFGHLARASSLCGACRQACPVDIDLPKLLLRVRAGQAPCAAEGQPPNAPGFLNLGLRAFAWMASGKRRFAAAQKLAGVGARWLPPFNAWLHFPTLTGWGYSKDFPRPALKTFSEGWKEKEKWSATGDQPSTSPQTQPPADAPTREVTQPALSSRQERFSAELGLLGGQTIFSKPDEVAGQVKKLMDERGLDYLLAWDDSQLPEGLLDNLREAGLRITCTPDPLARAGLTGALAGVAETGSLVLTGGRGMPLAASLTVQVHIALLRADRLYETLAPALNLPQVRQNAAAALVTGPSRTADIEMALTIGMHGPREVIVLMY